MSTIKQWQAEIDRLSNTDKEKFKDALLSLNDWPMFAQEYSELLSLETMIHYSIEKTIHGG